MTDNKPQNITESIDAIFGFDDGVIPEGTPNSCTKIIVDGKIYIVEREYQQEVTAGTREFMTTVFVTKDGHKFDESVVEELDRHAILEEAESEIQKQKIEAQMIESVIEHFIDEQSLKIQFDTETIDKHGIVNGLIARMQSVVNETATAKEYRFAINVLDSQRNIYYMETAPWYAASVAKFLEDNGVIVVLDTERHLVGIDSQPPSDTFYAVMMPAGHIATSEAYRWYGLKKNTPSAK